MLIDRIWKFVVAVMVVGHLLPVPSSFAAPSEPVGQDGLRAISGRFYIDNKITYIADGVPANALVNALLPMVNAHLAELGFSLSSLSVVVSDLPTPDLNATLREMTQIPTGGPEVVNIAIAGASGNGKFGLAIPAVLCKEGVNSAMVAVYRGLSLQQLQALAVTIAHELGHVFGAMGHSTIRENGVASVMFPSSVVNAFGYAADSQQEIGDYLTQVKSCVDSFPAFVSQLGQSAVLSNTTPFEIFERSHKQRKIRFFVSESDNSGYPTVSCQSNKVGKVSIKIKKRQLKSSQGAKKRVVEVRLAGRHRKNDIKHGVINCEITSKTGVQSAKSVVF